jgi:hypothetical protein
MAVTGIMLRVHPAGMTKPRYCFRRFLPQGYLPKAGAVHYLLHAQAREDSPELDIATADRGSSSYFSPT